MKTKSQKISLLEENYLNAMTSPNCLDVESKFMDLCEVSVRMNELTWKEVSDFFNSKS